MEGTQMTTSQAQDEPTQPAETTIAFIGRILLKVCCYLLCGYIVLKTFEYATNTSIPLDDRERTVKMVGSLLEIILRLLWWSISAQSARLVPPQKPVESVAEILQNIISNKKPERETLLKEWKKRNVKRYITIINCCIFSGFHIVHISYPSPSGVVNVRFS